MLRVIAMGFQWLLVASEPLLTGSLHEFFRHYSQQPGKASILDWI
jgi:hypothetical protein